MLSTQYVDVGDARSDSERFDVPMIMATMNRLLREATDDGGAVELVDLQVLGPLPSQPSRRHIVGKIVYRACNCVVTVHDIADVGALKGLETRIAAD